MMFSSQSHILVLNNVQPIVMRQDIMHSDYMVNLVIRAIALITLNILDKVLELIGDQTILGLPLTI